MLLRLLLAAAILPALVSVARPADTTAAYSCEDGTRLTATFQTPNAGPGSVELRFAKPGTWLRLPQVLSADGGRYADGETEFWIKGRQATMKSGDKTTTCETKQ